MNAPPPAPPTDPTPETKMAANNNMIIGVVLTAVIGGFVGLQFVGGQQSAKNQQNNVDNLPALLARMETLESKVESQQIETARIGPLQTTVDNLRDRAGSQLSKSEIDAQFAAVRDSQSGLEQQLSRRIQLEVKEPILRELDWLRKELDANRSEILEHMNTPPSTHEKDHK